MKYELIKLVLKKFFLTNPLEVENAKLCEENEQMIVDEFNNRVEYNELSQRLNHLSNELKHETNYKQKLYADHVCLQVEISNLLIRKTKREFYFRTKIRFLGAIVLLLIGLVIWIS